MLQIVFSPGFHAHVFDAATGRHLGYIDVQGTDLDARWHVARGLEKQGWRVIATQSVGTLARGGYVSAQVA